LLTRTPRSRDLRAAGDPAAPEPQSGAAPAAARARNRSSQLSRLGVRGGSPVQGGRNSNLASGSAP
ncbi:hypothetical protein CMUS01_15401, partial [Colletotrichum musicola]